MLLEKTSTLASILRNKRVEMKALDTVKAFYLFSYLLFKTLNARKC